MTLFLIGLAIGLGLNWFWRRAGKLMLLDDNEKWRKRMLKGLSHDDFIKLRTSVFNENDRRFHGSE